MMQQFVETIKVKNGKALALAYHQARMERTIAHFFPALALTAMPRLEEWVVPKADMDLFKTRVVYGEKGVEKVEYASYAMRPIRSLRVVCNDSIGYDYKSVDRSALNALVTKRGNCDEIVIVKNGMVTDSSYTNLALYDGHEWLTPRRPLLLGTKRAFLLDQGLLKEADLTLADLRRAQRVSLFNAMIDMGERVVEACDIAFE